MNIRISLKFHHLQFGNSAMQQAHGWGGGVLCLRPYPISDEAGLHDENEEPDWVSRTGWIVAVLW